MTRKLKILDEGDYFLNSQKSGGNYNLSYKLALCYAVHNHLHSQWEIEDIDFKEILENIKQKLNSNEVIKESYLSFYPIQDKMHPGSYVYIDHQKGCFPLIIYEKDFCKDEKMELFTYRKDAIIKSLEAMITKASEIYILLKESQNWNEELQQKIIKVCPDPPKKIGE